MNLRWPPDRFYWSIIDAANWRRSGALPAGLRPPLEEDVPISGSELHAVAAPLGDGRLLICAAAKADLQSLDPAATTLAPDGLPAFVESPFDPSLLNLLIGEFEPASKRRARHRRQFVFSITIILCLALVSIGLGRRASHQYAIGREARAATEALIAQIAPGARPEFLALEVSRARQSAENHARLKAPIDAAPPLAELLAAWPAAIPCKPQSINTTGNSITLSILIDGDPLPFLEAIRPPAGWAMEQPRLNTAGDTTRIALQFRAVPGEAP